MIVNDGTVVGCRLKVQTIDERESLWMSRSGTTTPETWSFTLGEGGFQGTTNDTCNATFDLL